MFDTFFYSHLGILLLLHAMSIVVNLDVLLQGEFEDLRDSSETKVQVDEGLIGGYALLKLLARLLQNAEIYDSG